jgi:hypothetical protein
MIARKSVCDRSDDGACIFRKSPSRIFDKECLAVAPSGFLAGLREAKIDMNALSLDVAKRLQSFQYDLFAGSYPAGGGGTSNPTRGQRFGCFHRLFAKTFALASVCNSPEGTCNVRI